jgi:hypothetical protein
VLKDIDYRASLACQVRTNIRFGHEISYQTLTKIFKNELPYNKEKHLRYFLGFFEECSPALIKKFMEEQSISRDEIIGIFQQLPDLGETYDFKKALKNGKF